MNNINRTKWEPRDKNDPWCLFCKNCGKNFFKHTQVTLLCPVR